MNVPGFRKRRVSGDVYITGKVHFNVEGTERVTIDIDTTTIANALTISGDISGGNDLNVDRYLGVGTSTNAAGALEVWYTGIDILRSQYGSGFANLWIGAGTTQQKILLGAAGEGSIYHSTVTDTMHFAVDGSEKVVIGTSQCEVNTELELFGNLLLTVGTTNIATVGVNTSSQLLLSIGTTTVSTIGLNTFEVNNDLKLDGDLFIGVGTDTMTGITTSLAVNVGTDSTRTLFWYVGILTSITE